MKPPIFDEIIENLDKEKAKTLCMELIPICCNYMKSPTGAFEVAMGLSALLAALKGNIADNLGDSVARIWETSLINGIDIFDKKQRGELKDVHQFIQSKKGIL